MTQQAIVKSDTKRLNVELPADLDETYANLALISHSPSEVILDFARVMPNVPKAKVRARVILAPINAKLLLRALADNLQKYEASYGEIKIPDNSVRLDPLKGFTR